jgi:uncharacterized protein YggT (Ycf19 family)
VPKCKLKLANINIFQGIKVETVFYIIARCVRILLDVISLSMMVRMLLPLFADVEENHLYILTVAVTEPLIIPIRFILDKFGIGENTPIDMGFLTTYFLLAIVDMFLPII